MSRDPARDRDECVKSLIHDDSRACSALATRVDPMRFGVDSDRQRVRRYKWSYPKQSTLRVRTFGEGCEILRAGRGVEDTPMDSGETEPTVGGCHGLAPLPPESVGVSSEFRPVHNRGENPGEAFRDEKTAGVLTRVQVQGRPGRPHRSAVAGRGVPRLRT